jgi:hypothetical protein
VLFEDASLTNVLRNVKADIGKLLLLKHLAKE